METISKRFDGPTCNNLSTCDTLDIVWLCLHSGLILEFCLRYATFSFLCRYFVFWLVTRPSESNVLRIVFKFGVVHLTEKFESCSRKIIAHHCTTILLSERYNVYFVISVLSYHFIFTSKYLYGCEWHLGPKLWHSLSFLRKKETISLNAFKRCIRNRDLSDMVDTGCRGCGFCSG